MRSSRRLGGAIGVHGMHSSRCGNRDDPSGAGRRPASSSPAALVPAPGAAPVRLAALANGTRFRVLASTWPCAASCLAAGSGSSPVIAACRPPADRCLHRTGGALRRSDRIQSGGKRHDQVHHDDERAGGRAVRYAPVGERGRLGASPTPWNRFPARLAPAVAGRRAPGRSPPPCSPPRRRRRPPAPRRR